MGLGCKTAKVLSSLLAHNKAISHLDLSNNQIGKKGFLKLLPGLLKNTSLVHLNLGCNDIIGEESDESIFEQLINQKSLISLIFSNQQGLNRNRIGWKGCMGLSKLISNNFMI